MQEVAGLAKYNLVLFDADGTLFDYNRAEETALKKAFAYHNYPYSHDALERYREINNSMWKKFEKGAIDLASLQKERFEILLGERNLKADVRAFNSIYLELLSEGSHLNDGAFEVCSELSRHCILAIATNGTSTAQIRRVKNSSIAPYIKHIVVSDHAGYQKPQQGFFNYAFDMCSHKEKETAIMVGDSLSADMRGGISFGISTCWYNPDGVGREGVQGIDYEIRDLRELINLIV